MGWKDTLSSWWVNIRQKRRGSAAECQKDIIKSPEDSRSYRGLMLNNGLKVLVISDPHTDKSAASLDVNVGHTSDPDKYPGLAHLCEHMLFMGTKKAQEVSDYKIFLSEHGGSSNAYTSMEHTNYHVDVAAEFLGEALARFSKFIRNPSFSPYVVEREIQVVSAEHEKNVFNDQWRLFQLNKSTANPEHPYSKFGTGNRASLLHSGKKETVESLYQELVKFHSTLYSANIMCLVVLGRETLKELEEMVVPLFSCVKSNKLKLEPSPTTPYGPKELKVQMQVVPVKDMQNMLLTWPIVDMIPLYKIKPAHYIGHCIGNQCTGSVFSELKRKGWVNSFAAAQKFGGKGYMFFCISMDLTDEGFNNTDSIITMVFQYLHLIRTEGIKEEIYKECAEIKSLRFRYKDKELPRDYVSDCSELLHVFPFRDVLIGPWLMMDFQPHVIADVLSSLNPENVRVMIRSPKFSGETNHVEKWYGTEYSIHPIPEITLQTWRGAGLNSHFTLPPKNEFIPTTLSLEERETEPMKYPVLLEDTPFLKLWFKQDNEFLLPKTYITLLLTSFAAHRNCFEEARGELMVDLLNDHLEDLSYPAQLAGSIFDIFCTSRGITMTVQGFSDRIEHLSTSILEKIIHFQVSPSRFEPIKKKYVKLLGNFDREPPFKQAKYISNCLLSTRTWMKPRLLEAAKGLTADVIQTFVQEVFSEIHIEMLSYGNITRKQAVQYAHTFEEMYKGKFSSKALPNPETHRPAEIKLGEGFHYLLHHFEAPSGSPKAILVQWQCGEESTSVNVLSEMFVHLINQHVYDVLRTQRQLGYIVICDVRGSRGVRSVRLLIQSHLPLHNLTDHILNFMKETQQFLEGLSQNTFENHKYALQLLKSEKPKRLMDQSAQYWREISTCQYQFDRHKTEAEFLANIDLNNVLDFYKKYFTPESGDYRCMAVLIQGNANISEDSIQTPLLGETSGFTFNKIEDLDTFKKRSSMWTRV